MQGTKLTGQLGLSAQREVLLGFAPAAVLHSISFPDALDEDTGRGYQRRFDPHHSLDFRKYVQREGSCTPPLTFNLRPYPGRPWELKRGPHSAAVLLIPHEAGRALAQVDCQHRLGYLNDLSVSLPFMIFIGLSIEEEMEIFRTINSKAKGLSTSLLDYHDATLAGDLAGDRPELFIALHLNNCPDSPWHRQLDLGGTSTSGLLRRASLRTMQKAIKKFLSQTKVLQSKSPEVAAQLVLDFWSAVSVVLKSEWDNPRRHLLNKGVGVYALMAIAGDLYVECTKAAMCDKRYFISALSDFIREIDWSNEGPLNGFGGEAGVKSALYIIRQCRRTARFKVA